MLSPEVLDTLHYWAAAAGAVFVVGLGYLIRHMRHKKALEQPLIVDPPGPEEFPHKHVETQPARDRSRRPANAMNQIVRSSHGGKIAASACPHDCPSTCALEVEVLDERPSAGCAAPRTTTTRPGVICAKVARYAERIHHPERLTRPLRRKGAKGSGEFAPISWDDALDLVAEKFLAAEQRYGAAGGLALLLRRHHGTGHARRHQPAAPRQEIFRLLRDHLQQPRPGPATSPGPARSPAPIRARWRNRIWSSSGAPTPSTPRST